MTEYECPVCKLRTTQNHAGDRHMTKCRHFGDNSIYNLHRVTKPVTQITEPVTHAITEPATVTVCEKCGHDGAHSKAACKQRQYRLRKAS